MEALGAISEGVWSSLSGGMYITEEANFMAQLLGKCTFPMNLEDDSAVGSKWVSRDSSSQSAIGESLFYSNNTQMSNYSENLVYSGNSPDHEGFYLTTNTSSISMDHCPNHDSSESSDTLKTNQTRIDLESIMIRGEISPVEDENPSLDRNPKKRSRRNGDDDHHETRKRNVKAKTVNISSNSSPSNSEDDSNGAVTCSSLSPKGGANLPCKTRASRGTATDPQSLYARKRRERINERLRILQNIVPNGTKVDISTMLEEAVHYVKFLQLQIKLLSSDELWMYAPIAYNGMDINLETSKRR